MIFRGRKGAKMKRLRSLSALICAVLLAAAVPGVYAAGDVSDVPYKQIVIAMGEGAKAALSAFDDRIRGIA